MPERIWQKRKENGMAQESLICTPEIARAILERLSAKGRANVDRMLPIAAANWQRNRIAEHLRAKLVEAKRLLTKKKYLIKKGGDDMANCILARDWIGAQIDLLKSLLADLK